MPHSFLSYTYGGVVVARGAYESEHVEIVISGPEHQGARIRGWMSSRGSRPGIPAQRRKVNVPRGTVPVRAARHGSGRRALALAAALLAAAALVWRLAGRGGPPEVRPLAAPLMRELPEFQNDSYKEEMYWGSYRAGLYFGMRTRRVPPPPPPGPPPRPHPLGRRRRARTRPAAARAPMQPRSNTAHARSLARPQRSEHGPLVGLMWFDPQDQANPLSLRHEAQQDDRLRRYGWVAHDGRRYGRQEIEDGDYSLNVTMAKAPDAPGAGFGGDWAFRFEARRAAPAPADAPPRTLSALVYVADSRLGAARLRAAPQGFGKRLKEVRGRRVGVRLGVQGQERGSSRLRAAQGVGLATGRDAAIGAWSLTVRPGPGGGRKRAANARASFAALPLKEEENLAQIKGLVRELVIEGGRAVNWRELRLPNRLVEKPAFAIALLTFNVTDAAATSFDVSFVTGGRDEDERLEAITGDALTALISEREAAFDRRFDAAFPAAPLGAADAADAAAPPPPSEADVRAASKAALSNLVGSMGYFYGSSLVQLPPGARPPRGAPAQVGAGGGAVVPSWRAPLFTCTPSRSFFPRGFLWDEGFHQLLLQRWDAQISRDAMAHWLDLMNAQGWVAREQILGAEARARVPAEFVVQHPTHANPPSLLLPLVEMARAAGGGGGGGGDGAARAWLERAWPRLEAWYAWYNRTQAGQLPGSYMWHGRDPTTDLELNPKTLTSGLDDYPRASHPTKDERHVDLLAWMASASRLMAEIGAAVRAPRRRVARYAAAAATLGGLPRLKALHYDEGLGQFLDYGLHSEAVALERFEEPQPDGSQRAVFRRVVREPPVRRLVPAYGYVSLFPLLMGLLPPDCPELGRQIELLTQQDLLWTPFGLRSLAKSASIYKQRNTEHDAPYWRGQIWMPINYLALRALHQYSSAPGPHADAARDAYRRLRRGLVTNLAAQYRGTGYLWEQYDDDGGQGISSHPFTGWTALLTLAVAEVY
ncbi:MAG: glycoside hydrolase [Monoraphidium minutum]|nr:MAG: glycoside hydrolase [Monoraphidium minutum]